MKASHLTLLFLLLSILIGQKAQAQDVFNSQRELNDYIYQNSDLERLTSGYFLNNLYNYTPNYKDSILEMFSPTNEQKITIDDLLLYTQIMEKSDVTGNFKRDSLFYPALNEIYSNGGWNETRIPLFISYLNVDFLKQEAFERLLQQTSTDPFPPFSISQISSENVATAGLLVDSLFNNHLTIYWNDETTFKNVEKEIEQIQMLIGRDTITIPKNSDFSLDDYYTYNTPLTSIRFYITFNDQTSFTVVNELFVLKYTEKDNVITMDDFPKSGNTFPWALMEGGFDETASIKGDVRLDFNVLWGCDPHNKKTLDKPFIMVSGWGPFTDKDFINNNQGWPSTNEHFYWSINKEGYIDSLVGAGYDVVFVKFYPPNASVLKNSQQLELLIKMVNLEKYSQGAYQENVISGYSAGAMCVRLTLERMEKKHLDDLSNAHHHCKLFVSFDGEHGGANVPLGLQHAVNYLQNYHNPLGLNFKVYTLNYILNAPLSQELLAYFHTQTGNSDNPGQGAHPNRTNYLGYYSTYNHIKNNHNPYYPAFTRNISISNGSSVRTATSQIETFHPFSPTDGDLIFKNSGVSGTFVNERTEVYLLGKSSGLVFKNESKPLFKPWKVRVEAVTNNPLILDNAPGGTTFLASSDPNKCGDENIVYNVLDQLEAKTQFWGIGNADFKDMRAMYSFTPTILTHDIRNFTPTNTPGGGRLYYDMQAEGLMFTSIDKINNVANASEYYGYPHLAHPTDHYTVYTPFDAVFSWKKENTVHIQSGHAKWNDDKNSLNCSGADKHERWEQHDSPIRAIMRSFILGEADTYNAYIQNRHYGWNANDNYTYKADVVSKNNIFAGDSVTQRTDFKQVIIEPNADVQFIACNAVHIKPGFHAKAGSKFHAKIDTDNCIYCPHSRPQSKSGRSVRNMEFEMADELSTIEEDIELVRVYPNPSLGFSNIEVLDENVTSFEYMVYDIMGKLIHHETVEGRNIRFELKKGIYIIQTKINESWYTKKLIMQ